MAKHLSRAQSVVSEIVEHLERSGLLERQRDPRDRRRVLVWLTDAGLALLERAREVLSPELLERALSRMSSADRRALLHAMQALLDADEELAPLLRTPNKRKKS
jgi:DNA-binding MarR family transcriptional regulator